MAYWAETAGDDPTISYRESDRDRPSPRSIDMSVGLGLGGDGGGRRDDEREERRWKNASLRLKFEVEQRRQATSNKR